MLISHFTKKVPAEIGGNEDCCDNCKRAFGYTIHSPSEKKFILLIRGAWSDFPSCILYSTSQQRVGLEATDSVTAKQTDGYPKAAKLLFELIAVSCTSQNGVFMSDP